MISDVFVFFCVCFFSSSKRTNHQAVANQWVAISRCLAAVIQTPLRFWLAFSNQDTLTTAIYHSLLLIRQWREKQSCITSHTQRFHSPVKWHTRILCFEPCTQYALISVPHLGLSTGLHMRRKGDVFKIHPVAVFKLIR